MILPPLPSNDCAGLSEIIWDYLGLSGAFLGVVIKSSILFTDGRDGRSADDEPQRENRQSEQQESRSIQGSSSQRPARRPATDPLPQEEAPSQNSGKRCRIHAFVDYTDDLFSSSIQLFKKNAEQN